MDREVARKKRARSKGKRALSGEAGSGSRRRRLLEDRGFYELRFARWLKESRLRFRPQWAIGRYTADFLVFPNLVIELDGLAHGYGEQRSRDLSRDRSIRRRGFKIVRFGNNEIIEGNRAHVIAQIRLYLGDDS